MPKLLCLLFIILLSPLHAEDQVEPLKTRPRSNTPKEQAERPKKAEAFDDEDFRHVELSANAETSLQLSLFTPLGQEVFPEKRFRAWGDVLTLSFSFWDLTPKLSLHGLFGAGFTLIRLTLNQPATSFTHTYLLFPVQLRLVYSLSKKVLLEGFAGAVLRPWELDSRPTTDGGFHKVSSDVVTGDIGAGISYLLTPAFFLRFSVGYSSLQFGGGLFL